MHAHRRHGHPHTRRSPRWLDPFHRARLRLPLDGLGQRPGAAADVESVALWRNAEPRQELLRDEPARLSDVRLAAVAGGLLVLAFVRHALDPLQLAGMKCAAHAGILVKRAWKPVEKLPQMNP